MIGEYRYRRLSTKEKHRRIGLFDLEEKQMNETQILDGLSLDIEQTEREKLQLSISGYLK